MCELKRGRSANSMFKGAAIYHTRSCGGLLPVSVPLPPSSQVDCPPLGPSHEAYLPLHPSLRTSDTIPSPACPNPVAHVLLPLHHVPSILHY